MRGIFSEKKVYHAIFMTYFKRFLNLENLAKYYILPQMTISQFLLSGKKVNITPAIPKITNTTDHLRLKSNNGSLPYPIIKSILTKSNAIPCSCFFIIIPSQFTICIIFKQPTELLAYLPNV